MVFYHRSYRTTLLLAFSVGAPCSAYAAKAQQPEIAPVHTAPTTPLKGQAAPVQARAKKTGALEEITVRSNKRAQQAYTIPASIVQLSGKTLQLTGWR